MISVVSVLTYEAEYVNVFVTGKLGFLVVYPYVCIYVIHILNQHDPGNA